MYKSIYFDKDTNEIHLWGDGQHGDDGYSVHQYEPYAYLSDPEGDFVSIDGLRCRKINSWSPEAEKLGLVYEYNVKPSTRFLIDKYIDSDSPANGNKVLYLDIEVARGDRYSTTKDAANVITSIAYCDSESDVYTCLLLDADNNYSQKEIDTVIDIDSKQIKVKLVLFKTEVSLLFGFLNRYESIGHNIISGWNVEFFDMPYLYNRMVNVLGYKFANRLSPNANIVRRDYGGYGLSVYIAGVTIFDYLGLYKKFTYKSQSNYRLDTIAKVELGRGKIEYEGDLDYLYKTDIEKFAKYNVIDVELIVSFENKLHFIDTALGLCHKGHVQHSDIQFTSAYLDGAVLTYCKRMGMVASSNRAEKSENAIGAFVRTPNPGLYRWVYDLDLTSLYPMNIISLNISPETKYCQVKDFDEEAFGRGNPDDYEIEYFRDNTVVGSFDDVFESKDVARPTVISGSDRLRRFLRENNLSIASNGVAYTKNKQGVIPAILDNWFKERAEYKSLRKKHEKSGDSALATFYDQQQLITKILLNSLYGVLLLPNFRFYDKHNGEAVTLTGQSVIKWASRVTDFFYNRELDTDKSYCIYTDTDSIFEPLEPLFVHRHGDMSQYSDDDIIKYSKEIINEVQTFVNHSYGVYSQRYHNIDEHRWDIKQELIAKRAFWVGNAKSNGTVEGVKKRYAQWIVDKEGHAVNELDVKGLDVVRSNFPLKFRKFMRDVLIDILHDNDSETMNSKVREFKAEIDNIEISDILLPTGVSLDKYENNDGFVYKKGTPVHVKAVFNYNNLLKLNKTFNVSEINSGDKVVWGYLKDNPYKLDSIAIKGFEDPPEIIEFVNKYVDREKIFDSVLKTKLVNFWASLGWGDIVLNDAIDNFFDFS